MISIPPLNQQVNNPLSLIQLCINKIISTNVIIQKLLTENKPFLFFEQFPQLIPPFQSQCTERMKNIIQISTAGHYYRKNLTDLVYLVSMGADFSFLEGNLKLDLLKACVEKLIKEKQLQEAKTLFLKFHESIEGYIGNQNPNKYLSLILLLYKNKLLTINEHEMNWLRFPIILNDLKRKIKNGPRTYSEDYLKYQSEYQRKEILRFQEEEKKYIDESKKIVTEIQQLGLDLSFAEMMIHGASISKLASKTQLSYLSQAIKICANRNDQVKAIAFFDRFKKVYGPGYHRLADEELYNECKSSLLEMGV